MILDREEGSMVAVRWRSVGWWAVWWRVVGWWGVIRWGVWWWSVGRMGVWWFVLKDEVVVVGCKVGGVVL